MNYLNKQYFLTKVILFLLLCPFQNIHTTHNEWKGIAYASIVCVLTCTAYYYCLKGIEFLNKNLYKHELAAIKNDATNGCYYASGTDLRLLDKKVEESTEIIDNFTD